MGLASKPLSSLTFENYRRDFRDRRVPGEVVNQYDERAEIERFLIHLMRVTGCPDQCVQRNMIALRRLSFSQLVNWSICVHHWTIEQWENVWQDKSKVFENRLSPYRPRLNDRWQFGEYENATVASAQLDIWPCNIYPPQPYGDELERKKALIEERGTIPTLDEWLPRRPPDKPPPGEPPDEPPPTGGGSGEGSGGRPPRQRQINFFELGRFPGLKGPFQPPADRQPVLDPGSAPEVTAVEFADSMSGPFSPPPLTFAAVDQIWLSPFYDDNDGDFGILYQVQATLDPSFVVITHWDSGPTAFAAPQPPGFFADPILYDGVTPPSGDFLFWRVRIWDSSGLVSPWFAGSFSLPLVTFHSAPLAPNNSPVTDMLAYSFDDISYTVSAPYTPGDPLYFQFRATDAEADDIWYYQIQVSYDPTFSVVSNWDTGLSPVLSPSGATITGVPFGGVPLIPGVSHFWRVRTRDAGSVVFGPWSAPLQIAVLPLNAPPTMTALRIHIGPSDVTGNPLPGPFDPGDVFGFSFEYNDLDGDVGFAYQIQVSTDATFGAVTHWNSAETLFVSPPADHTRTEVTPYLGSPLSLNATYHVRFRARDISGNLGPWSPIFTFQTTPPIFNAAPLASDLRTANDPIIPTAITNPLASPLYFNARYTDPEAAAATFYQFQLATDVNFSSIIWDTGMTPTSIASGSRLPNLAYAGPALSDATSYWVRVRFWDDVGNPSPFLSLAFTTAAVAPTASDARYFPSSNPIGTLISGETNFPVAPSSVNFLYTDPQGDAASEYRIEVADAPSFALTSILWDTGWTPTSALSGTRISEPWGVVGNLTNGITIYVRVRVRDAFSNESAPLVVSAVVEP